MAEDNILHFLVTVGGQEFEILLRAGSSMGEKIFDFELPLDEGGELKCFHRAVCRCQWSRVYGYPCIHAWMCLYYLPKWAQDYNHNRRQLFQYDVSIWHYRLSKWYFQSYHLRTMLAQCGESFKKFKLPVTLDQEKPILLFPAFVKMPKSKRHDRRHKKKAHPNPTKVDVPAAAPRAASSASSANNWLTFDDVPAPLASVCVQTTKQQNTCRICNSTSHSERTCTEKTTEHSVNKSTFLKTMLKMSTLTSTEWQQLQNEPWHGHEGANLRAAVPNPMIALQARMKALEARVKDALQEDADEEGDGEEEEEEEEEEEMVNGGVASSREWQSGGGSSSASAFEPDEGNPSPDRQRVRLSHQEDQTNGDTTARSRVMAMFHGGFRR